MVSFLVGKADNNNETDVKHTENTQFYARKYLEIERINSIPQFTPAPNPLNLIHDLLASYALPARWIATSTVITSSTMIGRIWAKSINPVSFALTKRDLDVSVSGGLWC